MNTQWTQEQISQRARYALSLPVGDEVAPNLLTFEGLPRDWKARIEHQQAENDRLHSMCEILRNNICNNRQSVSSARQEAYLRAATIAQYFCTAWGDEKNYPSVIGLEISEEIERESARQANQ